jgi:hypothetical protein
MIQFLVCGAGDVCLLSGMSFVSQEPNLMIFPNYYSYYIICDHMSKFRKQIKHPVWSYAKGGALRHLR